MSFGLYVLGYTILIAGLIWGATLLHVPVRWIGVGAVEMIGLGIASAVKTTRQQDSST